MRRTSVLNQNIAGMCDEDGIEISESVEYVGIDVWKLTKQLGKKDGERGKCVCRETCYQKTSERRT